MDNSYPYLTTKEAAAYLRYKSSTLDIWRSQGVGPKYIKIKGVRYPRKDLDQWAQASTVERLALESGYVCHQEQKVKTKRLRGRAGAEQRLRRLAAEPDCRDCKEFRGILRKAEEVDHIIPLSLGGTDKDDNIRCLCSYCHKIRTEQQRKKGN